MESKPEAPRGITVDYGTQRPGSSWAILVYAAIGMGLCVAVYIGSVWAGNTLSKEEDLGWYLYPAILALLGFFIIPCVAIAITIAQGRKVRH